jgi:epoxyqueuosine reductase
LKKINVLTYFILKIEKYFYTYTNYKKNMENKKNIMLHTCCAPCATACIQKLQLEGYEIILFFSNSNINSLEEFEKRKESITKLANLTNTKLIIDSYQHKQWLESIKGYEKELEKGTRCDLCFKFNLKKTFDFMQGKYELFTTTLTVSPHKNSEQIFKIGREFKGFKEFNFKKEEGFKKSIELTKKYNLYRQKYCGCEFSIK